MSLWHGTLFDTTMGVMRAIAVLGVVLASTTSCAAEHPDLSADPRETCAEFFENAKAITIDDGTPVQKWYRCSVELDPMLVVPTSFPILVSGGYVTPLLEYKTHTGVFAFRGDYPERHLGEQCEWVTIDLADCAPY